jgi:predicted nucleotidyltransferase
MKTVNSSQKMAADPVLQKMVKRILMAGDPNKIILFGSRAARNAHSDSDYDVLVIEPSNRPRYKRAAHYRRALADLGAAKDILVWTPEEVAEWREVPNAFITTVLSKGIVLYEKQG